MPKFIVEREIQLVRTEIWEVEETDSEEAGWNYFDGALLENYEKVHDTSIINVEEIA